MAWKNIVCFVVFSVVHSQGVPLDQAGVCVNPRLLNYFTDEASHITPLLQPNVYATSRSERSVERLIRYPREESTNEAERESRRRDWLPEENERDHWRVRRHIDDTHVLDSSPQVETRRDHTRGNGRNRQRSRIDHHDSHGSRSRIHSNLPGTRGNDRGSGRHRRHGEHDTHRDRSRTHTNSRGDAFHHHNSLHSRTPAYDKRQLFTDVKKSLRQLPH